MTGLSYERVALLCVFSVPFYRNLEFGQFYVVLLLLIVAAVLGIHAEGSTPGRRIARNRSRQRSFLFVVSFSSFSAKHRALLHLVARYPARIFCDFLCVSVRLGACTGLTCLDLTAKRCRRML